MLATLVDRALASAYGSREGRSHAGCSTAWVQRLSHELLEASSCHAPADSIKAFCRAHDQNRSEFRTNELLFDILVAETCTVEAARGKPLRALQRALWIVESELERSDSRDVLIDLNKLVIAKAVNKVLVISGDTPLVPWARETMVKLLDPRESNIFLVTISHPQRWCDTPPTATAHRLSAHNEWVPATDGTGP